MTLTHSVGVELRAGCGRVPVTQLMIRHTVNKYIRMARFIVDEWRWRKQDKESYVGMRLCLFTSET